MVKLNKIQFETRNLRSMSGEFFRSLFLRCFAARLRRSNAAKHLKNSSEKTRHSSTVIFYLRYNPEIPDKMDELCPKKPHKPINKSNSTDAIRNMKRKRDTNIHFGNDTLQKKMLKWTSEEDQKLLRLKKQGKSWKTL